jgi:hypothetical protein
MDGGEDVENTESDGQMDAELQTVRNHFYFTSSMHHECIMYGP